MMNTLGSGEEELRRFAGGSPSDELCATGFLVFFGSGL
jgi:hypothetical protein